MIHGRKAAGVGEVIFDHEHGNTVLTQQLWEIVRRIKQKRLQRVIVGRIAVDGRAGQIDPMMCV